MREFEYAIFYRYITPPGWGKCLKTVLKYAETPKSVSSKLGYIVDKMKDKSTLVKYTREELTHVPDETDWEKVDTMTDEEVYQDARNDKDAQPTDKTFWEKAPLPSQKRWVC